jgi:hypothetical protein
MAARATEAGRQTTISTEPLGERRDTTRQVRKTVVPLQNGTTVCIDTQRTSTRHDTAAMAGGNWLKVIVGQR